MKHSLYMNILDTSKFQILEKRKIADKSNHKFLIFNIVLLTALLLSNVAGAAADGKIIVTTNRYVILDDPNAGTTAPGFFSPADVRGGNWGTNYWSGESTTIRAAAIIMSSEESKLTGVIVTFKLINPAGGSPIHTATSITDGEGAAYYSYDLNSKNYWGNWKIDASATVSGSNISNSSSFVLYWWGCGQCHNSESPGNWGTMYTAKSFYTMGYDFHRSQNKAKHTETMAKGNCVTCHQMYNGIPIDRGYTDNTPRINVENEYSPDWHNGKVTCQGCHAGSNISANPQGKNPEIAGCYDTAGCHPKKNTNVNNENSTSGYIVGGSYKSLYSNIPNSSKAHTVTSVRCILCHNAGHNISKPYNVSSTSNSNTENEQCWTCHTARPTHFGENCTTCHTQDVHKISAGGGGPDCISCHDVGKSAQHRINNTAIDSGVHSNINSNAVVGTGINPENKKCWACHQSDGKQPIGMGDIFQNPYKCYDCHGVNKPYAGVGSAPTVSNHFKSGNSIKAFGNAPDNSSSCIACHNTSEMKLEYKEDDIFSSNFSLASHYGKMRTDMTAMTQTAYCTYCHNSSVENVVFGVSDFNNSIVNHTSRPTTPLCANCHDTITESLGRIHNSSLTKPVSNDSLCKSCHGPGGSASTNNKVEHKNLYCTECHANSSTGTLAGKDIHGIKYLTQSNTFSTSNVSAVNCVTCHQTTIVDSSLSGFTPFKIMGTLHHSDNEANGSVWGNYWTLPQTACIYCHSDTKHNATPLGRSLLWAPGYQLYGAIGANTTCANCHYKGDSNYTGMSSAFALSGLPIPPEISNGTSWNGKTSYFNHSLSTYMDQDCKGCHGSLLSAGANMSEFLHNVAQGLSGGPNCVGCHDIGGIAPKHVDVSVLENSSHKNLNSASADINKACYACHGNGNATASGHPPEYKSPKKCADCHTGTGNYSAPIVARHTQVADKIVTHNATCESCHNNTGMYLNSAEGLNVHYEKFVTDISVTPYQHFGPINTSDCKECHLGANAGNPAWGSPPNISTSLLRKHTETETEQCDMCHKSGSISSLALVDFHNTSVEPATGGACIACHTSDPNARYYVNISNFGLHADVNNSDGPGNVTDNDCKTCHFGAANITMSFGAGLGAANSTNTWFCDACHTTAGSGPIKPTDPNLFKNGLSHGSTNCQWCHIAGDPLPRPLDSTLRFHPNGPRGTAAGKNCLTCHYYANLPDLPFHAPGEGHGGDITQCGYCHDQADNHGVTPMNSNTPPTISGLSATTPVFAGSPVQVEATVNEDMTQIAAAQYQVKNGSTIVKDWTGMTPKDGRFNSLSEVVNASIDTSSLLGTYTVNVKGMASAPKTGGGPYYPLNGQWSGVYATQFLVKQPEGYGNGTVYGTLGAQLAGAIVSTDTGISTTTNGTGFYSLSLANGTYQLTASKEPEYYTNSSVIVTVTAFTTITQDITLTIKPIGTISGKVSTK